MTVKFQIYRKASANKKIVTYLTRRDYIDICGQVDDIDGIVVVDPLYVGNNYVYVEIQLRFYYGNEGEDVTTNSTKTDRLVKTRNLRNTLVYPPTEEVERTELQEKLISRLGNFAFPFRLKFPTLGSPSYVLDQGSADKGHCMGIEYAVRAYCGFDPDDAKHGSTSLLTIMRHSILPDNLWGLQVPRRTATRTFMSCTGSLTLNATLNKPVYTPGEEVHVSVFVESKADRDIKKLKVKLIQISEAPMFKKQSRDRTFLKIDECLCIPMGSSYNQDFALKIKLPQRKANGDIFIRGTNEVNVEPELAPSTFLPDHVNKEDIFGIHISYAVRIKCTFGSSYLGDAILDVPFYLSNPWQPRIEDVV